jgi:hypothetical protein
MSGVVTTSEQQVVPVHSSQGRHTNSKQVNNHHRTMASAHSVSATSLAPVVGAGSLSKSQLSAGANNKQQGAGPVAFVGSKPTLITSAPMRFLIMDAPRQSNLHLYIKEMKRHHVTDVVRVCECTYQGDPDLANAGIQLNEMAYDDGTSPPKEVISDWLSLVHSRFYNKSGKQINFSS